MLIFAPPNNKTIMLKTFTNPYILTDVMLVFSNCFMTYAWYVHLKTLSTKSWYIFAFLIRGVALFEYLIMVPANRIGFQVYSLAQLKIIQEVVTLAVFIPFAMLFMNQPFKTDYIWAALCLLGAVYFMFRS